jgi:hypothetical protein
MSHRVIQKLRLDDLSLVQSTADALGCACTIGRQKLEIYDGEAEVDASFKLPDWLYPVGIDVAKGEVVFDNYGGSWGDIAELDKFVQEYNLQAAERQLQALYGEQGWMIERREQADGLIQAVAYK